MSHNITAARYADPEPLAGYQANARVIATHASGAVQERFADDDNDDGGMLAFLAGGGVIGPYQPGPATAGQVNVERDRRAGEIVFAGRTYQTDERSRLNISGAGSLAIGAMMLGKAAGDYRWADPDFDFSWTTSDNQRVLMDAQTMFAFATAVAGWVAEHITAARALKDASPIPADYTNNSHWPTGG